MRTMNHRQRLALASILTFLACIWADLAFGQGLPVSVTVRVYSTSPTPTVVATGTYAWSTLTCNQPTLPVIVPVNPNTVFVADPAVTGRWCSVVLSAAAGGTIIDPLPDGNYTGSVQPAYTGGTGPESTPRVPFSRVRVFPALSGLAFTRVGP